MGATCKRQLGWTIPLGRPLWLQQLVARQRTGSGRKLMVSEENSDPSNSGT